MSAEICNNLSYLQRTKLVKVSVFGCRYLVESNCHALQHLIQKAYLLFISHFTHDINWTYIEKKKRSKNEKFFLSKIILNPRKAKIADNGKRENKKYAAVVEDTTVLLLQGRGGA